MATVHQGPHGDADSRDRTAGADLVEASPFLILRVSNTGELLYSNPACKALLDAWGVCAGQAVPQALQMLIAEALSHGASHETEIHQSSRVYAFRAVSGEEGRPVGIYGYDITERKQLEEALIAVELDYRHLLDTVGRAQADPMTGRFMRANARFQEMTGYSALELGSMTIGEITHPDDRERDNLMFQRLVRGEVPDYTIEKRYLHKDGSSVWVEVQVSFVRDAAGQPAETSKSAVDLTAQKRAAQAVLESQRHLELSIAAANLGLWSWELGTDKLTWSEKCRELFGVDSNAEITFPLFESLVHPDDLTLTKAALARSVEERSDYEMEYRILLPDGSLRWLYNRGRVFPGNSGLPAVMMGASIDISRRKHREERLAKAVANLERSNKDLERFAYVASHDLQEPVRTIRSYVQLLEKRYMDRFDDDGREFLQFVIDGTGRLQALIADLLEYSRVRTQAGPLVSTESEDALRDALAGLQKAILESGASVEHDALPGVVADRSQLAQVFQNLVGNAIKFRRQGAPPHIYIGAREADQEWIFSVSDNGIGIDPAHHQRVFTIFQRLHSSAHYKGSGVGLAICKRIVERHGGRIWLESIPERGSTFYFSLPKSISDCAKLSDRVAL